MGQFEDVRSFRVINVAGENRTRLTFTDNTSFDVQTDVNTIIHLVGVIA